MQKTSDQLIKFTIKQAKKIFHSPIYENYYGSAFKQNLTLHLMFINQKLKSGEQDVKYDNNFITHLKQDAAQMIYKQLGRDETLKLVVYADASHGNLPDGGSQ